LKKLARVVNEALIGKEKAQKLLLSGIIEAMLTWLSNDQEFWDLMENTSFEFDEQGLQQVPYFIFLSDQSSLLDIYFWGCWKQIQMFLHYC
jgi:hypothetical protein